MVYSYWVFRERWYNGDLLRVFGSARLCAEVLRDSRERGLEERETTSSRCCFFFFPEEKFCAVSIVLKLKKMHF
jgi:hypothetical protein